MLSAAFVFSAGILVGMATLFLFAFIWGLWQERADKCRREQAEEARRWEGQ